MSTKKNCPRQSWLTREQDAVDVDVTLEVTARRKSLKPDRLEFAAVLVTAAVTGYYMGHSLLTGAVFPALLAFVFWLLFVALVSA